MTPQDPSPPRRLSRSATDRKLAGENARRQLYTG